MRITAKLLIPTGVPRVAGGDAPLAPRPNDLRGKRIGILDNTKPSAPEIMGRAVDLLTERYGLGSRVIRVKPTSTSDVPEQTAHELRSQCDVILTGIGD
jgi:hypothetical protein